MGIPLAIAELLDRRCDPKNGFARSFGFGKCDPERLQRDRRSIEGISSSNNDDAGLGWDYLWPDAFSAPSDYNYNSFTEHNDYNRRRWDSGCHTRTVLPERSNSCDLLLWRCGCR